MLTHLLLAVDNPLLVAVDTSLRAIPAFHTHWKGHRVQFLLAFSKFLGDFKMLLQIEQQLSSIYCSRQKCQIAPTAGSWVTNLSNFCDTFTTPRTEPLPSTLTARDTAAEATTIVRKSEILSTALNSCVFATFTMTGICAGLLLAVTV